MTRPRPRLPLQPLLEVCRVGTHQLADWVGCDPRYITRLGRIGVSVDQADRWCLDKLGIHPSEVWDEWWEAVDRETVEPDGDHGNMRGYRRHQQLREPACGPCRQANIDYRAGLEQRKQGAAA